MNVAIAMNVSSRRGRLLAAVVAVFAAVALGADAATDEFDGIQMKGLVDDLVLVGVFDKQLQIAVDVSCAGKSLAACYEALNSEYTQKVAPTVIKSFHAKLQELMKTYHTTVRAYVNGIPKNSGTRVEDATLTNIAFPDSEMHCVLGLIDLHDYADTPTTELLSDHIFYNQLANVPDITVKTTFVGRVDDYLKWRNYTDTQKGSISNFAAKMVEVKTAINNFSKPFCKLQEQRGLKWVTGNEFASAKLRASIPLRQMVIDGGSVYTRFGIHSETDKTVQHLLDSFWDYKKNQDIHNYRHKVSDLVDKYVLRVLTPKLIEVTTNAMQCYYTNIKGLNTAVDEEKALYESNYNKHHYLKSLIMSFKTMLLFYVDVEPITLPRGTSDLMVNTVQSLVESIENQQMSENEKKDPAGAISKLKSSAANSKFKGAIDFETKDDLNTIETCIVATERVISTLTYLTEAKSES